MNQIFKFFKNKPFKISYSTNIKSKNLINKHKYKFVGFMALSIPSYYLYDQNIAFSHPIPSYSESYQVIKRREEIQKKPKPIFYKFDKKYKIPSLFTRSYALLIDIAIPLFGLITLSISKYIIPYQHFLFGFLEKILYGLMPFTSIVMDLLNLDGKFRSIGKQIMGIEIIDLKSGGPIDKNRTVLRILFSILFIYLDPLFVVFSSGNRSLTDKFGEFVVIKSEN